ncbi:MAG: hypothetical protein V4656_09900 [Pseudomonadota bacterium]
MKKTVAPPTNEFTEVQSALGDLANDLTHDISDLGQNLRDAADLAPIALAKTLAWISDSWASPRRRSLMVGGVLLLGLGVVAIVRGARRPGS